MSLQAANPAINATVTASAGSGKTYMLITRIVRLLLEGADPGSILAMTFTRKAAAEMQQRLSERLYQLATVDDQKLQELLDSLGLDTSYTEKARRLYESHLYCDYPVRTMTFHSFCQDLLTRFPLEANIPPNFDLLESAELLIQQARDTLFNEATLDMDGELATELQALMQACGGLFNLDKTLYDFLHHRSDWWAFTDQQSNPVEFARTQLTKTLQLDSSNINIDTLYQHYFSSHAIEQITRYASLLAKHNTKTNLQKADQLAMLLATEVFDEHTFSGIKSSFIKKDGTPYLLKDSATLRKKLGDEDAEQLLELHHLIAEQILEVQEQLNRIFCYQLNQHWYYCGNTFIQHYQRLKQQRRLLDFTDLEWQSYKLLQDSDNALWIQYKLDQQIQHLLIDEFQDTNPTQWQLILPLLEEIAAAESEKPRSVFLVGDEKQSIYSFRRAKPELQQQASEWLHSHLQAQAFPLNKSWRSSPAIIDTVNAVFSQPEYQENLPSFCAHETHQQQLAGRVEVLPLWRASELEQQADSIYCRNPLQQARPQTTSIYAKEAQQIAQHIQQLVNNKTAIDEGGQQRAINYNDIFILVRRRSHVNEYERALRDLGIAYLGTNRGTFLSCLEIQDMQALLDTLLTPFNNLALAQVLKSPLFSASDNDLQTLAQCTEKTHWYERLEVLHTQLEADHPLHHAWILLSEWHALADKIPVHDLLDRIFSQADILQRYRLTTPEPLRARVQANLTLFLEMALDLDSGRYPSLMHFLFYLRSLNNTQSDAPDEAPMETTEPRVRIMTIHASKGLEAPVVYLADTINLSRDKSALSTLVNWPVEQKQPSHFQLLPSAAQQDKISQQLNQQQKSAQTKEDANLLYVAITRARQLLFVSGCLPERGRFINWYAPIFTALQTLTDNTEDSHLCYTVGEIPQLSENENSCTKNKNTKPDTVILNTDLQRPIPKTKPSIQLIAPSYADQFATKSVSPTKDNESDEDAQLRGIIIHRALETLNDVFSGTQDDLLNRLSIEFVLTDQALLSSCINIAYNSFQHSNLNSFFQPENTELVVNECPIQYLVDNQLIHGFIDRLIVYKDKVVIIDYKTHQHANAQNIAELAQNYQHQMQLYHQGIQQCWPEKTVECFLLFTECNLTFKLENSE